MQCTGVVSVVATKGVFCPISSRDIPHFVPFCPRWHRGVHMCALWPRSRMSGLRRSLSGCGGVDFQLSPSSRRSSSNLTPPTNGGAVRTESFGTAKQLDGDSSIAVSTVVTRDGHESPSRQGRDINGIASSVVVDGIGGNIAGIEDRAKSTFWSGATRGSGALGRSSLGSGSLASVVCDSPSEV